ncbi:MAG: hypothetical protein V2I33_16465 [Kangiellaceae bacterium]|jgi:hypothetical protein|nr:hypothetical protein [Kangiellaceae bacterium]
MLPRHFRFQQGKISDLPDYIHLGIRQAEDQPVLALHHHERAAHIYLCGVTGAGKSRFLESMIVQDIALGNPLCLIDPSGYLYRKSLDFVACCVDHGRRVLKLTEEQVEATLESYLFLDLEDHSNPLRINPLEPQADDSTEELVDDLLKVCERLFGSVEQMRRLRQILRCSFWVVVELNRLPESLRPEIPDGYSWPLNLHFVSELLSTSKDLRNHWVNAIKDEPHNRYVRQFWLKFFQKYSDTQAVERLESSWNILQYFLGDTIVEAFLGANESSIHIPTLMREKQSLFCNLPLGRNLKGSQLVGSFLATKFQRAAYRRSPDERTKLYSLYIDEFHEFCDVEFAKCAVTLRQYGLSMVNAHQSQAQPPFHNDEGRSILRTIQGNAQVKVLFRLDRSDAEAMAREVFELSHQKLNFVTRERTESTQQGQSTTQTVSLQLAKGMTHSWSRGSSEGWAKSATMGIGFSKGTNIGTTLTRGVGLSLADGISHTITEGEQVGVTETHSETHGLSVALGKNWSHMRDHRRGLSFSIANGESLAVQHGHGTSTSHGVRQGSSESKGGSQSVAYGEQQGSSRTTGKNYALSDGHGFSFVNTQGETLAASSSGPVEHVNTSRTQGTSGSQSRSHAKSESTALSELKSTTQTSSQNFSTAINMMRSLTEGISRNASRTGTQSRTSNQGHTASSGSSITDGGSEVQTTTSSTSHSLAHSRQRTRSESRGRTRTLTQSEQRSLAEAFSLLEQVSKSMSESLQRTASQTETSGFSTQETVTTGEASASTKSSSEGISVQEKKVFFTMDQEREIVVNQLQKLPRRHAIVTKEALGGMEIRTLEIPPFYYHYRNEALPEDILSRQRQRHGGPDIHHTNTNLAPPVASIEAEAEDQSQESWFADW